MSRYFFNLEQKEDTPDKLAKVTGKPTKHYLFASEINQMADRIRLLWQLNGANVNNIFKILNTVNKVDLETIEESFIEVLNNMPSNDYPSLFYVVYKIGTVDYVQMFQGVAGVYGAESTPFTEEMFYQLYKSDAPENQPTDVGYLQFVALLSQSGINHPVLNVLRNDFSFIPDFIRYSSGVFGANIPYYDLSKFIVMPMSYNAKETIVDIDGEVLQLIVESIDGSGNVADGILLNNYFEFRLYPE